MLNWTKPGSLALIGVLGLLLPLITRGVLPRKGMVSFNCYLPETWQIVVYKISIKVLQLIGKSVQGTHSKKRIDRIGKTCSLLL